jgi:hypothetical protein
MFGRQQRCGSQTVDESVPREIAALLSSERLILRETKRAVTPLRRVIRLRLLSGKVDLLAQVRQHMPIQWKSRNQIDPTTTFIAFLMTVLVGAKGFAHAALLRGHKALHALLGIERFPIDDTIRNLFRKFTMGNVQRLYIR